MGLQDIPFLSGYTQQGQLNRQNEFGALRQAAGVQDIIARSNAMRQAQRDQEEMERVKELVAQSGGDPTKAIEALNSIGNLKAMRIAAELQRSLPKPVKPELVDVQTPQGPMQRWVTPGESTGVDVGIKPVDPAAKERIQAQIALARERSEDRRLTREENLAARKELIRLTASLRQPPQDRPVSIVGDDGAARLVRQSNVAAWEGKTPAASSLGGILNSQTVRERQLSTKFLDSIKPYQETMKSYQNFEEMRKTGDNSQANQLLAQQLVDMGRRGTRALPKAELERILGSGDLGNDWIGRAGNMLTQMAAGVRTPSIDKRFNDLADAMAHAAAKRISQEIQNTRARTPAGMNAENVVGKSPVIYGKFIITPRGKIHEFGSADEAQAALDNAAQVMGQQ